MECLVKVKEVKIFLCHFYLKPDDLWEISG